MKLVARGKIDRGLLQAVVPDIKIVQVETASDLLQESADAEAVIGVSPDGFPELLRSSTKLRWVHSSSAGVDRFICDELKAGKVILTCAKDGPAGPNLADHAMALLLALSRNVVASARSDSWRRSELSTATFELSGKTACVVGYGAAGREIAKRAVAFGMNVVATKRNPGNPDKEDLAAISDPSALSELVSEADVVFNALPGTPETYRLFDSELFSHFKAGSIFVNVGRGTTVDTDALVQALSDRSSSSGPVAAGLDVVDPEPLPDGHPLWAMENVVITPHIAGVASQRAGRNMALVAENLRALVNGEPLKSQVDPMAGY